LSTTAADAMQPTLLTLAALAAVPIYEGRVHPQGAAPDAAPAFVYERRVAEVDDGLVASHLTRDPQSGALLIDETAHVSGAYALRRFEADNRQQGYRGAVTVSADGQRLDYELQRGGKTTRRSESIRAPAVAGPSLHGFILQRWDRLVAGDAVDVRMIVLAKTTSYGFRIRLHSQREGRTAFTVTPTNWFVRLAVAPLTVAFDSSTRQVLRYEGRVPPLRVVDGRAREFDARVDYTMRTATYR
jgi:hypothetical protein